MWQRIVTKSLEKATGWVFAHIFKLDWHLSKENADHPTAIIICEETGSCLTEEFEDYCSVSEVL